MADVSVRVVYPDLYNVRKLAIIAALAFEGREENWTPDDFLSLGGPPNAAMIVDEDFELGLLILSLAADEAEILNFGVVPEARGRGVGRALLQAAKALAEALGMVRLLLEVATDNAAARALYESFGFEKVGQRPRYYLRADGSRQDALVLSLELAAPRPSR